MRLRMRLRPSDAVEPRATRQRFAWSGYAEAEGFEPPDP
jgi:hypothetical protein